MKRAWILTAFGDIRGYRKWCRNPSNTPEIRRPIMNGFIKEVVNFSKKNHCQVKHLGDGFIFIFTLDSLKKKETCFFNVLTALKNLTKSISHLIHSCPWPWPDGFRMRITGGWVDVYPLGDGEESIGEAPNLARDLLYINPEVEMLVHSSVIRKLSADKIKNLKISKFTADKNNKRIEAEELDELWKIPL